jgi:hypothetical protein
MARSKIAKPSVVASAKKLLDERVDPALDSASLALDVRAASLDAKEVSLRAMSAALQTRSVILDDKEARMKCDIFSEPVPRVYTPIAHSFRDYAIRMGKTIFDCREGMSKIIKNAGFSEDDVIKMAAYEHGDFLDHVAQVEKTISDYRNVVGKTSKNGLPQEEAVAQKVRLDQIHWSTDYMREHFATKANSWDCPGGILFHNSTDFFTESDTERREDFIIGHIQKWMDLGFCLDGEVEKRQKIENDMDLSEYKKRHPDAFTDDVEMPKDKAADRFDLQGRYHDQDHHFLENNAQAEGGSSSAKGRTLPSIDRAVPTKDKKRRIS